MKDTDYWPCLFTDSDTTGEKDFEEFYIEGETLDLEKYSSIGVIKNTETVDSEKLEKFESEIYRLRHQGSWEKQQLIDLFHYMIPNFNHKETGKYLDGKM